VTSFARIPHDAVPAIREAVRDRLLVIPAGPVDVAVLKAWTADAWHVWHQSMAGSGPPDAVLQYLLQYCDSGEPAAHR
jgi:hypothetical protein